MRVDIGCGLIVGVTHYLHGDQRIDAALIKQRHIVVPEITVRTALLDLLYEGGPEVPAVLVMNLYRDALVDACEHK